MLRNWSEQQCYVPTNFLARFNVIKKCTNKFDCLVNEMLCIQDLNSALNVQSDFLRIKVHSIHVISLALVYANLLQLSLFTNHFFSLSNLDNGTRCTETSVSITYFPCLMYFQIVCYKNE